MTETFVDTAYWLAMLHKGDAYHENAKQVSRPNRMVTTLAVLLEVMDALSAPQNRKSALQFWEAVHRETNLAVASLDDTLLEKAVSLFGKRPDKDWSLTDCISFIVMQERGITNALTTDHHFEQAGFRALLRE